MSPDLLDVAPAAESPRAADLMPAQAGDGFTAMVERVARDPGVDVAKLERLLAMQERVLDREAKAAFDAGFSLLQPDLPEIDERGRIVVRGETRATYARLEDIQAAIKPILATHGFAIRHRTEWPADKPGIIRIVGILSHRQGHSEESAFEAPMDKSEYRTDVQSQGSTVSYGRRYTTIDLLNITTRKVDNDGATAGRPQPPDGYEAWFTILEGLAPKDIEANFGKAKPEFKNYAVKHDKDRYQAVRAKVRARA